MILTPTAVEPRMRSRILEDRFFLSSLSTDEVTSCPGAAATRSSAFQHPAHLISSAWLLRPQIVQMTVEPSSTGQFFHDTRHRVPLELCAWKAQQFHSSTALAAHIGSQFYSRIFVTLYCSDAIWAGNMLLITMSCPCLPVILQLGKSEFCLS